MTLRAKLLLGFTIMLAMTIATAVAGWRSMIAMDNQAMVLAGVDNTISAMLRAQSRQLLYSITKDQSLVDGVNELIKESETSLITTQQRMITKEGVARADAGLAFLKWYKPTFERIVANDANYRKANASMVEMSGEISDSFAKLIKSAQDTLKRSYSDHSLYAFSAVYDAQVAYVNARLASRVFTGVPTKENARMAIEQLELSVTRMDDATNLFMLAENAAMGRNLSKLITIYASYFTELNDSLLENGELTIQVRDRLVETFENMAALSNTAMRTLVDAKSFGNIMSLIVASFSVIIGLGIAFVVSRNVHLQLGKDPSILAQIAQRVTENDYHVDDGSPRIGVYGNILHMVSVLHEHIENAQRESQRAHSESERAIEAMKQAEQATEQAQNKTKSILHAAGKLEDVANIVSSASSELSSQIELSERGATEQAARITETATAMEEMNSTVLEVARSAGTAADVSMATRQKAEAGAQIVRQAVHSIQQVQQQSVRLKEDMHQLDENAKAVSQIMGVISDIADQTNLLALNAAIEAARAGDAGRGFAVVADEVRKLAEKTMASTTDVGNAIKAIQQSAAQSMSQVDTSVRTIEEATQFANQSGAALDEIVLMVDNAADQVRAIATASEQQSATSDEISRSVSQVNTIAGETARAMEEAARAVSNLAKQAQVLTGLIGEMKRG